MRLVQRGAVLHVVVLFASCNRQQATTMQSGEGCEIIILVAGVEGKFFGISVIVG